MMRLPAEQYLSEVFDHIKKDDLRLSDWERGFMRDQAERYEQYSSDTWFSDKQWLVIMKIGDLFDLERVQREESDAG